MACALAPQTRAKIIIDIEGVACASLFETWEKLITAIQGVECTSPLKPKQN